METPNNPIAQIRAKLSQIVRRVHDTGEAVTITDKAKAVAILQPVPRPDRKPKKRLDCWGRKARCPTCRQTKSTGWSPTFIGHAVSKPIGMWIFDVFVR
ncbi:MAG: type II toxin-antitoxin system Phd/YefM family antitoxin [Desulfococcaceae bacterium]